MIRRILQFSRRLWIAVFGCGRCYGRGHYIKGDSLVPCPDCHPRATEVKWRPM